MTGSCRGIGGHFLIQFFFSDRYLQHKLFIIMNHKFHLLIPFFLLVLTSQIYGQLTHQQTKKIDSLFIGWNLPNHPGGSIAIMKDGKTVFSKAYGLASLEYLTPNSTETLFNIGSNSKQFTAMAIVLLNERNKLSFDDDIRTYIPEFPNFGKTITIQHLLHHTSGLRDLHGLLGLAGWRNDDVISNNDLNRIIVKQNSLNFKPGEELLYCNTGYMLLVNIIEKITGEKFKHWLKENIFDKLGMNHTYVEDQYDRVVPNNATSYGGNTKFKRKVAYWNYVGSGNMHSTTSDLLKWLQNFSSPQKNWESAFATLLTMNPLNNGTPTVFGFGVRIEKHLGKKIIQHGGAIGGFRSIIRAYPEDKLNIVVLSNFTGSDIMSKTSRIAEIMYPIEEKITPQKQVQLNQEPKKFIKLSTKKLVKFEGIYWDTKEKYGRKIYVKNDTLRYSRSDTSESLLAPLKKNKFYMLNVGIDVIVEFVHKGNLKQMVVLVAGELPIVFDLHKTIKKSRTKELAEYPGKYYSSEIETGYTITIEGTDIYIHHIRHGKIKLKRVYQDILEGEWPINKVEIKRSSKGIIQGLQITNGRVRNLWFKKML